MSETATPARNAGAFATTPNEFARVLKLLMGKAGGGKPPIETIGLRVQSGPDGPVGRAHHSNKMGTAIIHLDWFGIRAEPGTDVGFVTTQPQRLLDYLEGGLFAGDQPMTVDLDASGRLTIRDEGNRASVTTDSEKELIVPALADKEHRPIFGAGPNGTTINTNPESRPAGGATWEEWAGAGYTVIDLPLASIRRILFAGGQLFSHSYRNTQVRFEVQPEALYVTVADPKDAGAESVVLGRTEATIRSRGSEQFSVMYSSIDALWGSLDYLKVPAITLVHHPGEKRASFVAVEPGENGTPVLAYHCSWMRWSDPREKKAAK